ncbi:hypothetical protein BD309DRAFT_636887 [Dichomitus squalens]|nr:hypothetical protein BD309DRAFT_636887 [Dichomitus squalens]
MARTAGLWPLLRAVRWPLLGEESSRQSTTTALLSWPVIDALTRRLHLSHITSWFWVSLALYPTKPCIRFGACVLLSAAFPHTPWTHFVVPRIQLLYPGFNVNSYATDLYPYTLESVFPFGDPLAYTHTVASTQDLHPYTQTCIPGRISTYPVDISPHIQDPRPHTLDLYPFTYTLDLCSRFCLDSLDTHMSPHDSALCVYSPSIVHLRIGPLISSLVSWLQFDPT